MNIPTFSRFTVPADSTVDSAAMEQSITVNAIALLTEKNYGMPKAQGLLQGGFLRMSTDKYHPTDVTPEVQALTAKTGRKFKLGSPEEALHYMRQRLPYAVYFVVPSRVHNGNVVAWCEDRFTIHKWRDDDSPWDDNFHIFIVEDC